MTNLRPVDSSLRPSERLQQNRCDIGFVDAQPLRQNEETILRKAMPISRSDIIATPKRIDPTFITI